MAKKEAFLQFLKAARSLANQGLSKEAIMKFAKNEFGEITELFKKQIDSLFKPKKGIENIKLKDEVFDNTVIKLPVDDTGVPFNPNDPLKQYGKPKKSRMLDEDEYQEFLDEVGGADQLEAYNFDGTVGDAQRILKEQQEYMDDMFMEYKKGNLDPVAGDKSPARKKFLQNKYDEMEASGDTKLMTRDEIEELNSFDLQTDMDKAVEKFKKKDAKEKKIIKDFDPGDRDPSAEGGIIGYYTGGMVDVEPNLSDIGHGSDALMARTRLVSPDGQATTSTGLNYLLAEDNDNIRVPFSKGKGVDLLRRGFLKTMGAAGAGIAALKTGLLGFGKEAAPVAKEVIETVSETAQGVPPYFLNLVNKIRKMGESTLATKDKANAYKFKDYVMEEDFAGNIEIIKKGDDIDGNKIEDVYMSYKVDEVPVKKGGSSKVEEYEEFTARPDGEGKMKDVEPGVPDEVVQEGTMFEDDIIEFGKIKKASGGIARMIGE